MQPRSILLMVRVTKDAPLSRNMGARESRSNSGSFFFLTPCSMASRARRNKVCFSPSVNGLSMEGLFQSPILAIMINQRLALASATRCKYFRNEQCIHTCLKGLHHTAIHPRQPAYD